MKLLQKYSDVFLLLNNRERYFENISQFQTNKLLIRQIVVISFFSFIYGAAMGIYHSIFQALASGLKLSILSLLTIGICFPPFYIIQKVLGSKMTARQILSIILSGFVLMVCIVVAFIPIVVFFQVTGGNYHFLQLLHVVVFIFGGIFGLKVMVEALRFAFEKMAIYPQIGAHVFKIWIIILGFVSIQLAWNLRPFLCKKEEKFMLFRNHEGNFYTAIIYSIEQILSKNQNSEPSQISSSYDKRDSLPYKDTMNSSN